MPSKVFLSYTRDDHQLAIKFASQLKLPAMRDIDTFVDTEALPHGGEFSPVLSERLRSADWFILLYTQGEKRYEYSMFEAGQYFDSHHMRSTATASGDKLIGRFCCLYDTPEYARGISAASKRAGILV